jgi:hypothetical protein
MQFIKGGFSFRLKSKHDVWMRSFNESQIMTEEKCISCARYIEANPVRRGIVATPVDYRFSSAVCGRLAPHACPHEGLRRKGQGLKAPILARFFKGTEASSYL